MLIWRFLILGLVAAWVGAGIYFGAVVAPAAFAALPTKELAGRVVSRLLPALNYGGIALGLLVAGSALAQALARRGAGAWVLRLALAFLMAALLAGSQRVSGRLEALRAEMGGIDQVAEDHPLRLAFGRLHTTSVRLYGSALVLAVALFCLEAREAIR